MRININVQYVTNESDAHGKNDSSHRKGALWVLRQQLNMSMVGYQKAFDSKWDLSHIASQTTDKFSINFFISTNKPVSKDYQFFRSIKILDKSKIATVPESAKHWLSRLTKIHGSEIITLMCLLLYWSQIIFNCQSESCWQYYSITNIPT